MFVTAGNDGSIQLYHIFEKYPLRAFECFTPPPRNINPSSSISEVYNNVTCARFSPVKPTVFATSCMDGNVYIYDLYNTTSSPLYTLDHSQVYNCNASNTPARTHTSTTAGITYIAFNPIHKNLLVCCDITGHVHIWKLNAFLSNKHSAEDSPTRTFEHDMQSLNKYSAVNPESE